MLSDLPMATQRVTARAWVRTGDLPACRAQQAMRGGPLSGPHRKDAIVVAGTPVSSKAHLAARLPSPGRLGVFATYLFPDGPFCKRPVPLLLIRDSYLSGYGKFWETL